MSDEKVTSEDSLGDTDKILTTAPIAKSDKVAQEVATGKKVALPTQCHKEKIEWSKVKTEVAAILSQSDSMRVLLEQINSKKGNLDILTSELPSTAFGELAQTGRSPDDPKNRELVAFQFVWSKIESRFQLASVMAHEYNHAKQILDREFTATEAAPFLKEKQYLVLRWWSEYEAFDFQTKILKEIIETMVEFKPCSDNILEDDKRIRCLWEGELDKARAEIVGDYTAGNLSMEYSKYSKVSPEELKEMEEVKIKVEYLIKSTDWETQEKIWG